MTMNSVVVTGSFDDLKSRHIRFLEESSKLGNVHVLLWADEGVRGLTGKPPKFPAEERSYMLQAIRYVSAVTTIANPIDPDALPTVENFQPAIWAVDEASASAQKLAYCAARGLTYYVVTDRDLQGFPITPLAKTAELARRKKVVVTGCYDWFHSGHVRFFEEVSELGDLYVVAGSDANVRLLKGEGHPLFPQDERRYFVQAIRYVKRALISTGEGWMDAEPEIALIKPDMYAVNEDGDKPEKREFCEAHGIQYVVLKRTPKAGLPRRQSTDLRGF
jgi:cytidyltransferase-like protein